MAKTKSDQVAVLISCLNEEQSIAQVVCGFETQLPDAQVFVFDNNWTARMASETGSTGANVRTEERRGKGIVVQSISQQVDADRFALADGVDTHAANKAIDLIGPILNDWSSASANGIRASRGFVV